MEDTNYVEVFKNIVSNNIKRSGIDSLMSYLDKETDFFRAPASTKFHLDTEGGLVQHSVNVYTLLRGRAEYHGMLEEVGEETIAIVALFHDLCKINMYRRSENWRKDANNKWESYKGWKVEEDFPAGHGEKSVFLLQQFMALTNLEILSIRWHMGPWEHGASDNRSMQAAFARYPFAVLTQVSDMEAANVLESKVIPNLLLDK